MARPTHCRHTHVLRRTASADLPIGSGIITAVQSDACRAACGHPSGKVASARVDLEASEVRTSWRAGGLREARSRTAR